MKKKGPDIKTMQDSFHPKKGIDVKLTSKNQAAQRKKGKSSGGVAYVSRPIFPKHRNIYNFKMEIGKEMDVWIGIEKSEPKHVWMYRVLNGHITDSSNRAIEYSKEVIRQGDEITMTIYNGEL
jgi:hypothetical protein